MVKVCDCCSSNFFEPFSPIGRLPSLGCPDTDDWHCVVGRMSQSHSKNEQENVLLRANSKQFWGTDYQERFREIQDQLEEEHANFSGKIKELQKELEGPRQRCQDLIAERKDQLSQANSYLDDGIEKLNKQLLERLNSYETEVADCRRRILQDESSLDGELKKFREVCRQEEARIRNMIDISQKKLLDETSRYEADDAKRTREFQNDKCIVDDEIEKLRKQLHPEVANLNGKVEELQKLFLELPKRYEAEVADRMKVYDQETHTLTDQIDKLRDQSSTEQGNLVGEINKLEEQSRILQSCYEEKIAQLDVKRSSQIKMLQKLSLEDNTNVIDEAEKHQKEESTIASGELVDQSPKDNANASGGTEELDSPARDENVELIVEVENHESQPLEKNTIVSDEELQGHSREDITIGSGMPVEVESAELSRGIEECKQPLREVNADLHSKIDEVMNPCRGENANIDNGAQELESQSLEKNRKEDGSIEELLQELEVEHQKLLSDREEQNLKDRDDNKNKIEDCRQQLDEVIQKFSSKIQELQRQSKVKEMSFHEANAEHMRQFQREKDELESEIMKTKTQQQEDVDIRRSIEKLQRQWQDQESAFHEESEKHNEWFQIEKTRLECKIKGFEKSLEGNVGEREKLFLKEKGLDNRIKELRKGPQVLRRLYGTLTELEEQFRKDLDILSVEVEDLQLELPRYYRDDHSSLEAKIEDLEARIADLEARIADLEARIADLETQIADLKAQNAALKTQNAVLKSQNADLRAQKSDLRTQNADFNDRIKVLELGQRDKLAKRERQLQDEFAKRDGLLQDELSRYKAERVYHAKTVADLKNQNAELERAKQDSQAEIERLVKRLQSAELHNANASPGGESFSDAEATPHLLNRAVERVNTTSGNFTKLLMVALKEGGVDCSKVAKALTKSVRFERDAHTKFVYQALICKVLFANFESECFNIEENAPPILDSEQPKDENFRCYKQLLLVENPEELVYEDATDSDFRRFCNKKQNDLIAALAASIALSVPNVGLLLFGKLFGRNGLRRPHPSTGLLSQMKVASSFLKCALSVFVVHKLAFALQPTARIFRVRDSMEFNPDYMDGVVMLSADSDTDDEAPLSVSVGFMVVPGFFINRIVVHCKVYAVKR